MKFMKIAIITMNFIFCSSLLLGQIRFSLSDYEKGDLVGIKSQFTVLRGSPDSTSMSLDTIKFDWYNSFIFRILDEKSINNFVYVKTIIKTRKSEVIDSTKQIFSLQGAITEDGLTGWVNKDDIKFNSIPDFFILTGYASNLEVMDCIIRHAEWQQSNNYKEYDKYYRATHAESYFIKALSYYENDSLQKAIFNLTKSIQILPKKTSYKIRAISKAQLDDYQGAISDCTKGINFENTQTYKSNKSKYITYYSMFNWKYDSIDLFYIRGYSYLFSNNFNLALADLNIAIKNDNQSAKAYLIRAYVKLNLGQKQAACLDFSKAGELGEADAYNQIKKNCN